MRLIKEPLEVDFEFEPRPLTKEEREQISSYIKAFKARNSKIKATIRYSKDTTRPKKVIA